MFLENNLCGVKAVRKEWCVRVPFSRGWRGHSGADRKGEKQARLTGTEMVQSGFANLLDGGSE